MLGLLPVLLCGCIKTKDELTINADGSGSVRIETQAATPPELAGMMGASMGQMGGAVMYPPVGEAEGRQFFPGKDFNVTVNQQKADNGDVTTVIQADFKDINTLLASPYGRAHQLSVCLTNGSLVVRGVSGMEAAAQLAGFKDDTGMAAAHDARAGRPPKAEKRDALRVPPHAAQSAFLLHRHT